MSADAAITEQDQITIRYHDPDPPTVTMLLVMPDIAAPEGHSRIFKQGAEALQCAFVSLLWAAVDLQLGPEGTCDMLDAAMSEVFGEPEPPDVGLDKPPE